MPIYKVSLEEARWGAVFPGNESPVLMLHTDCSLSALKPAYFSPYLPPSSDMPSWKNAPFGLNLCRKIIGGSKQFAQLVSVPEVSLSRWVKGKIMPSFESLLKLCYVLDITPLQLMNYTSPDLEEVLKTKKDYRLSQPRNPRPLSKNQESALELIKAVLDGREAPQSISQLERRLGLGRNTIVYHYPEKAALVSSQYRAYRKEQARQRLKRRYDEIKVAVYSLNAQGIFPTKYRVSQVLSNNHWHRNPELREAWSSALRELELKS